MSNYESTNSTIYTSLTLKEMITLNPYSIIELLGNNASGVTKELVIYAITKEGYIYSHLPSIYKNDKELIFHAVNQNGLVLEFVEKDLQEISHIYFAVKQNGLALRFANLKLCDEEIYNIATNQNGLALEYVPEHKHTEQIIINAIDNNYEAIQFLGHITKRIAYHAIRKNINSIQFIPELYINEYELYDLLEGIDKFINKNPSEIENFPHPNIEMYKSVIDIKKLINNLPDSFQTEELSIYAVSMYCLNLKFVKDQFKEACKTYLKNNENCKTHTSHSSKDYCAKNSEN
jgi:hypothetical protein